MKPALVDVSVLILFFNRPKLLAQVFEQVKKARPARLFLYQDGPRGEHDMPGIEACRKVVADIDWECEVHHNYQEKNYGCHRNSVNVVRSRMRKNMELPKEKSLDEVLKQYLT